MVRPDYDSTVQYIFKHLNLLHVTILPVRESWDGHFWWVMMSFLLSIPHDLHCSRCYCNYVHQTVIHRNSCCIAHSSFCALLRFLICQLFSLNCIWKSAMCITVHGDCMAFLPKPAASALSGWSMGAWNFWDLLSSDFPLAIQPVDVYQSGSIYYFAPQNVVPLLCHELWPLPWPRFCAAVPASATTASRFPRQKSPWAPSRQIRNSCPTGLPPPPCSCSHRCPAGRAQT